MKRGDPKSLARRPSEKSKLLGQVFTPAFIASYMAESLSRNCQDEEAKILDPCVGPYTFPQALLNAGMLNPKQTVTVVDVDQEMVSLTDEWGIEHGVNLHSIAADYLELPMSNEYDYAILNPPYVRQEWLDKKSHYQELFKARYGLNIPGTSNLYIYFLVKVIMDLKPRGHLISIVYDSWQSTQYGQWLLAFFRFFCNSLQIKTVSNQPFDNRLIDATIIQVIKKSDLNYNSFSYEKERYTGRGVLFDIEGFSPVHDIFSTQRGLRLKQANFFLSSMTASSSVGATPFIKKIGKLRGYSVPEDHPEAALLIASDSDNILALNELQRRITFAEKEPEKNVAILTWFQERPDSWFLHGEAPYAPILFNYYLRNRPKHIFNSDRKYADNFYGLLPLDNISPFAYVAVLNSTGVCAEILAHARNQGNGLSKIQLYEYRNIYVPDLRQCSERERISFHKLGLDLVERPHLCDITLENIDTLIAAVFDDPRLTRERIREVFKEVDLKARRPKEIIECLG